MCVDVVGRELRIPKLRAGSFFPSLLERCRRVDQALFAVMMKAYLHGVSTRKVDDLVRALGADSGISKVRGEPDLRRLRGTGAGLMYASCRCRDQRDRPTETGAVERVGVQVRSDSPQLPNSAAQAGRILAVAQDRG